MSVVFHNSGVLDIRALTIHGMSVKITDKPFGFFGTGLKYAVSILLRTGHTVVVSTGGNVYRVSAEDTDFRGQPLRQMVLVREADGQRTELPFTMAYGGTWSVEDAFRELWCNAQDEPEGGAYHLPDNSPLVGVPSDRVEIRVSGPEIDSVFERRWSIILNPDELELIYSDRNLEVYRAAAGHDADQRNLFYRGVRILTTPSRSLFVYNVLSPLYLTENRSLQYVWQVPSVILNSVTKSDSEVFMESVLTEGGYFEDMINYADATGISRQFADAAERARRANKIRKNASAVFGHMREQFRSYGLSDSTAVSLLSMELDVLMDAVEMVKERGLLPEGMNSIPSFHDGLEYPTLSFDKKQILMPYELILDATPSCLARGMVMAISNRFDSQKAALAQALITGQWPEERQQ